MQEVHHGADNTHKRLFFKVADLSNDPVSVSGEELAGSRVAPDPQRTFTEVLMGDRDNPRVGVGVAGDLAQDPIFPTGIGQDDRGTQLGSG